ncbi:OmpA family protein [Brachyspira pilosicoli]|uniref:OmpA family protein n=1 Tax=Brachyspira pilosicoli TaxID=52584 RepID=UPI002410C355|nr:OmpA family protein [Brachyspira pilosicoli]
MLFKKLILCAILILLVSCNQNIIEREEIIYSTNFVTNNKHIVRVHFDFDKFVLTKDFIETDILTDLRTNNNIKKLYIYGHTDNKGKAWYNYRLGNQRAQTVKNIISTNYPLENIILKSYGHSNAIADNNTELGRYSNRRADVYIDLVEESITSATNIVEIKENKVNININFKTLLIIILIILLITILIIFYNYILMFLRFILEFIKLIFNILKGKAFEKNGYNPNLTKKFIEISKMKYGKILLKIVKCMICRFFNFYFKLPKPNKHADNHIKGAVGELLVKLYYLINGYTIIGAEDYKKGGNGLDLVLKDPGGTSYTIVESKYGTSQPGYVEVKDTKNIAKQGSPEYNIDRMPDYLKKCDISEEEYGKILRKTARGDIKSKLARVPNSDACSIEIKDLY